MIKKIYSLFIIVFSLFGFSQNKISESYTAFNQSIKTIDADFSKVRFSGFIKIQTTKDAYISLWLRETFKKEDSLTSAATKYDFITNKEWQEQVIEVELSENTQEIYFGGFVSDFGKFFFDNLKLEGLQSSGNWKEIKIINGSFEQGDLKGWKEGVSTEGFRSVYYNYDIVSAEIESNESKVLSIHGILPKVNLYPDLEINSKKFNADNEPILITEINVIDVVTGKMKIQDVLISDKKIIKISKKIKQNPEYKILSGIGKWLIPGLVDSHIHLFQSGGLYTRPDAIDLTEFKSYEHEQRWLKRYAPDLLKRYLRCGITTVIDVGGPLSNFELRDKYKDDTAFPNLFITGPLVSTYQPKAFDIEDSPIIRAKTPQQAADLVKRQLPYKPDFIKIWYINTSEEDDDSNFEIVKSTIKEAHKNNLKVAVHATELKTAKKAIIAGADFLVHSVEDEIIDQEFIDLVKSNNIEYIPTLVVGGNYTKTFGQKTNPTKEDFNISNPTPLGSLYDSKRIELELFFKPYVSYANSISQQDKEEDKIKTDNLKIAIDNNFIVSTGTDAGNIGTLHATSYYDEIEAMKSSGINNLDILRASTLNGAKILDKENVFGSIEEGKLADVLVLNANPLENIDALKDISYVIKSGSAYSIDNIIEDSPSQLVQRQVNGYNARNIDAFLEPYSDDFEVFDFPNKLRGKGKTELKKGYIDLFTNYPELHCEIVNRMVYGNKIIDHERITGVSSMPYEAIAVYEIENGKIAKVTFLSKK